MGKLRDRFRRMIGRPGTADLTRYRAAVESANALEEEMGRLDDPEIAARAAQAAGRTPSEPATSARLELATPATAGPGNVEDKALAELAALGREAGRRGIGERAFDVQLLGALGLLSGHVIEMATGEGKTLSGALAAAGHALRGRRAHVITINDYLAKRDAAWMGPVYDLLGVSVGWVDQSSTREERRAAYAKQVTYAPVSEVGFDVLRDRMITDPDDEIVPEPDVAIIDEADSVLVDEARVPLVLAGSVSAGVADPAFAAIVKGLRKNTDFEIGEDGRSVHLTPAGAHKVEHALDGIDLYTTEHVDTLAAVNLALHARALLQRDVDYIVRDDKVQLINESRGRVAVLQRWPDGLQAAVEAKEGLAASESGEILDSITVQALLRRYRLLSGMTGTAVAVAEQLREFYELEVAVIPPNVPCVREDEPDRLYATVEDKEAALLQQIAETHATGRPILVGTLDVAESERIAHHLRRRGLKCEVLNAKNDAEEAAIIAEAGTPGAITVSTQMAGRGTDIRLGGSDGADRERIAELGGLYVMGLGRHPSSRLDDQLRGRAGRQGDPGGSVMFTSLRDDLVAHHAPEARLPDGDLSDGRVLGKGAQDLVGHAQRVAEGVHLETHRNTWRYNKLIEHQRALVLEHRDRLLRTDLARRQLAEDRPERAEQVAAEAGEDALTKAARLIALYHLDRCWTEHLGFLDNLREGIHLRSLGRLNPLDEFHKEAIAGWNALLPDARSRAARTFETAKVTEDGLDLAAEGLQRPTSTWTYMVSDTPFGTEAERALRRLSSALRRS